MNKIRTTALTAAIAGGSIIGIAGVTGMADAATDGADVTSAAVTAANADGETLTQEERQALREERRANRQADRQEVADLLGLEGDALAEQLRGGATLAEVAEAQGVPTSDVVDLIVQQANDRIDRAVENGRLTDEQAAEKAAELDERVQTRVEEGRPDRGDGEGRRGHRGPRGGGPGTDAAVDTDG